MRPWLVLATLLLAGCVDPATVEDEGEEGGSFTELHDGCGDRPEPGGGVPDWSKETIDYNLRSDAPFRVRVPVVLSEDGSAMADWMADLRGGGAWRQVETTRGSAIEITADDGVRVLACSIQPAAGGNGCCAEQYLDGVWSLGPGEKRSDAISLHVIEGVVDLDIVYHAVSDLCGREAEFGGRGLDAGWHEIHGQDGAWCT